MKNIFILSTDKPSRFYITNEGNFGFSQHYLNDDRQTMKNKNIYITSDEEIKDGDWYYDIDDLESLVPIYQRSQDLKFYSGCKKIILTTDINLAPDVQKIDDEFLEWFVNHPSCEWVEVEYGDDGNGYQVIIPKEEPKQETQGYICPQTKKQCDDECCVSAEDCHIQAGIGILFDPIENQIMLLKEDLLCVHMYLDDLKIPRQSEDNKEYSIVGRIKQLEKKYLKELSEVENHYLSQQDKNKYSEEDMEKAFIEGQAYSVTGKLVDGKEWVKEHKKEWFEQFKNK